MPTSRRSWWLNAAAFALMVAGALATDRKTALVVPVAVVIYIACYRPRQVLRLAPLGLVVLVGLVHLASPGALGTVLDLSTPRQQQLDDPPRRAISPTSRPTCWRIRCSAAASARSTPNSRLSSGSTTTSTSTSCGRSAPLGLLAFIWMILAPVVIARAAIRTRGPTVASLALATSGGCVAFLVVCALFDALSFPQAPYMFFVVAALTTIAAAGPEGNVVPARELVRRSARRTAGRPRAAARA